jgi:glycosyltransferase involved in cell wall biosynthesis
MFSMHHHEIEVIDTRPDYNIDIMNSYLLGIMKKFLTHQQYEVLRLSFGLDTPKFSALEIANLLDMNMATANVRVSQIKREAINNKKEDFLFKKQKSNIALFLGRVTEQKGAKAAYDMCNAIGQEIYFAGPNILKLKDTKYCKMLGFVEPEERKKLLSDAQFLLAPSFFVEPCNWTVIEAQFSGTPTITTDFGGFTETVKQSYTGFRCSTYQQFNFAVRKGYKEINPENCLKNAVHNFTIEIQCNHYEMIFKSLSM